MGFPYRVADVDDVILSTAGTVLGLALLMALLRLLNREMAPASAVARVPVRARRAALRGCGAAGSAVRAPRSGTRGR